jgi:hypothetical protein
MPQSRPPSALGSPSGRSKIPKTGYVRCGVLHMGAQWRIDILSDERNVAVLELLTMDGRVDVGLNRAETENLLQKLQLFLQDWPDGRAPS